MLLVQKSLSVGWTRSQACVTICCRGRAHAKALLVSCAIASAFQALPCEAKSRLVSNSGQRGTIVAACKAPRQVPRQHTTESIRIQCAMTWTVPQTSANLRRRPTIFGISLEKSVPKVKFIQPAFQSINLLVASYRLQT